MFSPLPGKRNRKRRPSGVQVKDVLVKAEGNKVQAATDLGVSHAVCFIVFINSLCYFIVFQYFIDINKKTTIYNIKTFCNKCK